MIPAGGAVQLELRQSSNTVAGLSVRARSPGAFKGSKEPGQVAAEPPKLGIGPGDRSDVGQEVSDPSAAAPVPSVGHQVGSLAIGEGSRRSVARGHHERAA